MGLAELKADCAVHRERILRTDYSKLGEAGKVMQVELAENVWPWLDGLLEAIREDVLEEVADLGEAIDEIIEREDSALHPELAAMVIGVFEAGKLICLETEKLLATSDDELGKKRVAEMLMAYRQGVAIVAERIAEVTIEEDDEKKDDEDPEFDAAAKTSIKPEGAPESAPEEEAADSVNRGEVSAAEILAAGDPDDLDGIEDDLDGLEG